VTEAQIFVDVLARAEKIWREKILDRQCVTRICHRTSQIRSPKLLKRKIIKMIKRTANGLVSVVGCSLEFGGKTDSVGCFKKALARSLAIFMPKRSRLTFQDWFLSKDDSQVHAAASVWDFKRRRRHKDDPLTALFIRNHPSGLVSE
jgi:hypothetical protein